jgi:predicted site-specific integrase-resolvase
MVASVGCLSMPLLRHHLARFSAKLFAINSSHIPPQHKPPSGAKSGLGHLINRSFFITPWRNVSNVSNRIRAAYYLRVSTEGQELDNQRAEIRPFIVRRGWKLECTFEDVVSGGKKERDRPGFAAMLKAAHQRKFDILVFWALDRLAREGTRATLNYLQRLESKGVDYVSYQEQWVDSTGPFKDVMISMFATLAKQERARISERTIAGLKGEFPVELTHACARDRRGREHLALAARFIPANT